MVVLYCIPMHCTHLIRSSNHSSSLPQKLSCTCSVRFPHHCAQDLKGFFLQFANQLFKLKTLQCRKHTGPKYRTLNQSGSALQGPPKKVPFCTSFFCNSAPSPEVPEEGAHWPEDVRAQKKPQDFLKRLRVEGEFNVGAFITTILGVPCSIAQWAPQKIDFND